MPSARPIAMRARSSTGGFTLIEIMVVFAIVALLAGASVQGFRSLRKADLREASTQLSGAMRYLFDRASTTGKVHRLVIDLEQGMYWAEVSDDRFYIPREESEQDLRRREEKESADDDDDSKKRERAAREAESGKGPASGSSFDLSKLEVGDFRPKRARFAAFKDLALKPVRLKKTRVQSVYTPRVTEPLTSGRGYVYFFPLGQTEPAIITMSDKSGETVFSLVVHPITGHVRIYNKEIQPAIAQQRTDDEGNRVEQ
jgi:general secretion pathway protein H